MFMYDAAAFVVTDANWLPFLPPRERIYSDVKHMPEESEACSRYFFLVSFLNIEIVTKEYPELSM